MAHTCNPSTLGGRGGWITRSRDQDHPGQHGETLSLLKTQKISWAWWCMPVIPATQEAEAGELLEPRRRRLQWADIMPLHSSLGNKSETLSRKKKYIYIYIWKFQLTLLSLSNNIKIEMGKKTHSKNKNKITRNKVSSKGTANKRLTKIRDTHYVFGKMTWYHRNVHLS